MVLKNILRHFKDVTLIIIIYVIQNCAFYIEGPGVGFFENKFLKYLQKAIFVFQISIYLHRLFAKNILYSRPLVLVFLGTEEVFFPFFYFNLLNFNFLLSHNGVHVESKFFECFFCSSTLIIQTKIFDEVIMFIVAKTAFL